MDLRERRTLDSIRRAFLGLRAEKSLERITVRELVERAQVGKATFYLHYHSIYDLSEQLQREAIDAIAEAISEPEAFVTAPDRVARQLFDAYREHSDLIDVLFAGEQAGVLAQSMETVLRERISEHFPELTDDPIASALLTYQIQGGFYAYRRALRQDADNEAVVDAISRATLAVSAISRGGEAETGTRTGSEAGAGAAPANCGDASTIRE